MTSETVVGKPTEATYTYGERALQAYHEKLHASHSATPAPTLQTIYMVCGNPASDIQGANKFRSRINAQWKSILVESGA